MRLVFAEPAAHDLDDIIAYIALDDVIAAERVLRAVESALQRLVDFPAMGRTGRVSGTRELPLPSLPYLLVYRVDVDTVTILAIFHRARDLVRVLGERLGTTGET